MLGHDDLKGLSNINDSIILKKSKVLLLVLISGECCCFKEEQLLFFFLIINSYTSCSILCITTLHDHWFKNEIASLLIIV